MEAAVIEFLQLISAGDISNTKYQVDARENFPWFSPEVCQFIC